MPSMLAHKKKHCKANRAFNFCILKKLIKNRHDITPKIKPPYNNPIDKRVKPIAAKIVPTYSKVFKFNIFFNSLFHIEPFLILRVISIKRAILLKSRP